MKQFSVRFIEAISVRCAEKPRTIEFYREKLTRLLEFPTLANANLDAIDEALIEKYVQERRKQVAPATVNRQLATLGGADTRILYLNATPHSRSSCYRSAGWRSAGSMEA